MGNIEMAAAPSSLIKAIVFKQGVYDFLIFTQIFCDFAPCPTIFHHL